MAKGNLQVGLSHPIEQNPSERREKLLAAQKDAFQAAMNGGSLAVSLGFLVNFVTDGVADGRRCAFFVANGAGTGISHIVGMSEAYARDVDGFTISRESLACGLAIATGVPQITRDVLDEPKWEPWTWMACDHGFRGCWSFPIETAAHKLVGSFAMYHAQPRDADASDIEIAEAVTQTAAIIISRHQENARRLYSEERYRALFEAIEDGFSIVEFVDGPGGALSDYVHVEANPGFERQSGLRGIVGKTVSELAPADADDWVALFGQVLRTGEPLRFERYFENVGRHIEVSAARLEPASRRQVAVLFRDIEAQHALNHTLEQRVAERTAELGLAEERLRQSQKMEAVGQLTGGIAHDFNNMLSGISGALEMVELRVGQGRFTSLDKYITIAQGAAKRAATLTHRLLAFSRQQTLEPQATNANKLIEGMLDLVQRTVGPSIEVRMSRPTGLWSTLVDRSQLENSLLNLCINARDAMPNGGRINIHTQNLTIDEKRAMHIGVLAGEYVALSVSDTGTGMPQSVIEKAFDPFFTTKPMGQGTGLGLSMIYGFVKQSGGQVRIESRVGEGTTICIYLPRQMGDAEDEAANAKTSMAPHAKNGEVVLIVDDEPSVRALISDFLKDLDYRIVEAADGAAGLRVLQSDARIDLVVTDVGLPGGMNGRQMIDSARAARPTMKSLFITGFADDALLKHGRLEPNMSILTKPFAMDVLADRVRELIARPAAANGNSSKSVLQTDVRDDAGKATVAVGVEQGRSVSGESAFVLAPDDMARAKPLPPRTH